MLRTETVSDETLELLKNLMNDEVLDNFFLVGGTALALQIGHRLSIDIDLFSKTEFAVNDVLEHLENNYQFQLDFQARNTLKGEIMGVKVDIISHQYPLVDYLIFEDGVRMASKLDIAAMKLNAISGSGTRVKDFIDVAYLSNFHSLKEMINAYSEKYNSRNPVMVVKALEYFNDINFNEPIVMLDGKYDWKHIETRLRNMTIESSRKFSEPIMSRDIATGKNENQSGKRRR